MNTRKSFTVALFLAIVAMVVLPVLGFHLINATQVARPEAWVARLGNLIVAFLGFGLIAMGGTSAWLVGMCVQLWWEGVIRRNQPLVRKLMRLAQRIDRWWLTANGRPYHATRTFVPKGGSINRTITSRPFIIDRERISLS